MVGKILGEHYEIQEELGKKTGRRTLLARNLVTGESVAIKLLSFSDDFEWDDLKLFEREVQTLKNLIHPAIPQYIDSFDLKESYPKGFALVQSYIPALTLEQHLNSGRSFTEAEVKQIAIQILEILVYLHQQNPPVIHRDIKPSNILLGDRSGNSVGKVYLIDFGSVQNATSLDCGTRTVVGTYGYMPPEQFGARTVPASDLYSLGATLIYLVTGSHPADLPQVDLQIKFKDITFLSSELADWLELMTMPSLERRLSSATAALQALKSPGNQNAQLVNANTKPTGSKIELNKSRASLEILIPPFGFDASLGFLISFAVAWNAGISSWTISAFNLPLAVGIPFALFSLPFWGAGMFMVFWVLFCLFGKVRLRLNQTQIALTYELFGLKFNRPRPSLKKNITKVIYVPRHFTKDSDGERLEVTSQLTIAAGVNEYQLAVNTGNIKSEIELEWLAQELSDWLGMPLTRE